MKPGVDFEGSNLEKQRKNRVTHSSRRGVSVTGQNPLLVVHAIFTQKIPQLLGSTTLRPGGIFVAGGILCFSCWKKSWCESASHFAEWNNVVVEVGGELFDGFLSMLWIGKKTISRHCVLSKFKSQLKRFCHFLAKKTIQVGENSSGFSWDRYQSGCTRSRSNGCMANPNQSGATFLSQR